MIQDIPLFIDAMIRVLRNNPDVSIGSLAQKYNLTIAEIKEITELLAILNQ